MTDLVVSADGANAGPSTDANSGSPDEVQQVAVAELARCALDLLENQITNIGQGGRRVFIERFGEPPPIHGGAVGATTSATMERLSFWLLGTLVSDNTERRKW